MCEISKVSHSADMCERRHRYVSHWKDYEEVELQQKGVVWQWKSTEARMIVKVNSVAMDTLPSTELHCVWEEGSGVFLLKSKHHLTKVLSTWPEPSFLLVFIEVLIFHFVYFFLLLFFALFSSLKILLCWDEIHFCVISTRSIATNFCFQFYWDRAVLWKL